MWRPVRSRLGKVIIGVTAILITVALDAPSSADYTRPGQTRMVSVNSDGSPRAHYFLEARSGPAISDNGRYVAYKSRLIDTSTNEGTPGNLQFVLYDSKLETSELVSLSSQGEEGLTPPPPWYQDTSSLRSVDLSGDGRFVAFSSPAPNLVPGDTNICGWQYFLPPVGPCMDVFVRDRKEGATLRVSLASDGSQANDASWDPAISADGRHVAFVSRASNLVTDDNNGNPDVFVHDLSNKKTRRISVASDGAEGNGNSNLASMSANGKHVVFHSSADNLVSGDTNTAGDVFVHNTTSGKTERVSIASDGAQSTLLAGSLAGAVSGNGRYVAFSSTADNLVPNITTLGCSAVGSRCTYTYMHDRKTGRTTRVSVTSTGAEPNDNSIGRLQDISSNGRFVTFVSNADNMFPGDPGRSLEPTGDLFTDFDRAFNGGGHEHAYIHDTKTGATELVTIDINGEPARDRNSNGAQAWGPSISETGRYISFFSGAYDLVGNDPRRPDDPPPGVLWHQPQYYVRDLGPVRGVGDFGGSPPKQEPPDDRICITPDLCIPPGAFVSSSDSTDDLDDVFTQQGANLYRASLAYRPRYEDLFVAIELEHMPQVTSFVSPIFYGLRFNSDAKSYEVRATSLLGGTFGLFDCTGSAACNKLADLPGGYGTTGMRVVFSLPLDEIGLERGGELTDVVAFSGLGSYLSGASKILDRIVLE